MSKKPIDMIEQVRNRLSSFLVGAFVGALIAFTFKEIPEENKDIITYMVGQLSGMATMALGFYFVNKVGQDALDAQKSENTGKLADAVTHALKKSDDGTQVEEAVDEVVDATVEKGEEVKGN